MYLNTQGKSRKVKSDITNWWRVFSIWLVLIIALPWQAALSASPALAKPAAPQVVTTNVLTLSVVSARAEPNHPGGAVAKGDPITTYKFILNQDNTGTTAQRLAPGTGALPYECTPADPAYPANCQWVSVAGSAGSSPIYTQGDQSDLAGGMSLPDGRYLISVLADGYKLDGAHFTIPLEAPGVVTVELQPHPLPTATIQAAIFEDITPVNSAPDVPAERGLAGFTGEIFDYIDRVTTDIFGNPLCTEYDQNGNPVPGSGGSCVSKCYVVDNAVDIGTVSPVDPAGRCPADITGLTQTLEGSPIPAGAVIEGKIIIPNLGPNRYALSMIPPTGSTWIQTTTLEGNHDWDSWVMEGATGLDTEFVVAGEPFPAVFFGYVPVKPMSPSSSTGHVKGVVMATKVYVPAKGGLGLPGTIWGGMTGAKLDKPIDSPWIALTDLQNGDTAVYIGQGNPDGSFDIPNVPPGNYSLSWWDEPQDYIFDFINVTVGNNEIVDVGVLPLTGWWTIVEGYVFNDLNSNGKRDPGEPGMANFPVVMKKRENSMMDRGAVAVTTDASGYYFMENVYPMTQWLVQEAYADLYYTTGVTYQADNQPTETTVLGQGVDVSVLPIIGLGGRLDWGVKAYASNTNGGIVGSVSYDTTRNELDPRYAAVENWQPGISGLTVNLYKPIFCGVHPGVACDSTGRYELATDGSFARGSLLNVYTTETWTRPTDCVARDVDGNPLVYPADQQVLPVSSNDNCLEGPLMGVQFGPYPDLSDPAAPNFGAAVDGNYGFGDGCLTTGFDTNTGACAGGVNPDPLTPGDYLVQVEIPMDQANLRPMYKVTREEDINIYNGDQWVPQIPPAACAGALHTVDVAGVGTDDYPAVNLGGGVVVPQSTPVVNQPFADAGGTPYEGQQKPLCDMKLVTVSNGRSTAPGFTLFTDVPIPGRFWGLLVDDLNFSSDARSLLYGEKAGVPFGPVGIYDYTNRLVYTTESDFNGLFDVLLPSTDRISCPTPSGVCANLYRFVGNDPGIPGRLNPNYNPQFRTIAAEFEAFPGLLVPADLAPTQVGVSIQLPGSQFASPVACYVNDPAQPAVTPELFRVSDPYVNITNGPGSFTITGQGFGAVQGMGTVTLDGVVLPVTAWSDRLLSVSVPTTTAPGPHQLKITADNGSSTTNGLTFSVLKQPTFGPFPTNPILDNFNRSTTSATQGLGANWGGDGNNSGIYRIPNLSSGFPNQVQVRGTGNTWWTPGQPFGNDQEAYFTFKKTSTAAAEQALLLKFTGSSPSSNNATLIEVQYNGTNNSVQVRTKNNGQNLNSATVRLTINSVSFASGDQFGARATADGTVTVFKNGAQIGSVVVPTTGSGAWAAGGGRIGVRFNGATSANDARFDDFGGGNLVLSGGYLPNIYRVGPGEAYDPGLFNADNPSHAIQNALDAAAASQGPDLIVVYPGTPQGDRINPRGAYYENLIINNPVKLQGVGPGGTYPDGAYLPGSIVDGSAYGGDTNISSTWRSRVGTLTWDGNQTVYEGQVIYLLGVNGQYSATNNIVIDGFDLRGGDQMGFPTNINQIGGGQTGLPGAVVTQGGAIYANAYVPYLQITNNVVQNNGGGYGTLRIGTPNIPQPDTNQHNENIKIKYNRIIANGGTNLAGAVGLFAGSDSYEVAYNDICGNFSAEYGGGISQYGMSPNGKIHHNRIYFNRSYDEGGGVMIAGELPADPASLSPGSGPVDIYNNLIQANLGNDDGGGLRFLMAGNFPMNVYNNMINNNVSTHEGGGISLNDTPAVRVFNNTIMKNLTTATAITSNGQPAPAGLSTSANSDLLQASLPGGSSTWSDPLLFNNIFWDNRAGTRAGGSVTGLGAAGDATPIYNWDLGDADYIGQLSPTNSILQISTGTIASGTNQVGVDPSVVSTYDTSVTFSPWRTNPAFIGAIMVSVEVPPNLMGNYHLQGISPAINNGAASKSGVNAPSTDYDDQSRPQGAGFDSGADELVQQASADLSVTKTDGQASVSPGSSLTYTIVVSNAGPDAVTGALVTDSFPADFTSVNWTCLATAGSSCSAANGSGSISTTVDLLSGGSATFSATAALSNSASGSISNTASVTPPAGVSDPNTADNSATDTDTIAAPTADLAITKSDGQTSVTAGSTVTYTIAVSNAGPNSVTGAAVSDTFPAVLSGVTWTCTASAGSSCAAASGNGNISTTVNLTSGGSATLSATATLAVSAAGTLANTASVAAPAGANDPVLGNNSATDSDTIVIPTLPALPTLDNFNRANANTLGANWNQTVLLGQAAIRVNTNQAFAQLVGSAYWNVSFGTTQGAAFSFANNPPINGTSLILKANGGTTNTPANFIRVLYNGTQVIIQTTTNSGGSYTQHGVFTTSFASGDTLSAVADLNGKVFVWKTSASTTTLVGSASLPTTGGNAWTTGSGRIGIQLPTNGRVDDFLGGSTAPVAAPVAIALDDATASYVFMPFVNR